MMTKLIDALLLTPSAAHIRRALQLDAEATMTEVLYIRTHSVAQGLSRCDIRVVLCRIQDDGNIAAGHIELDVTCVGVVELTWKSSFFEESLGETARDPDLIDLDTEDGFSIVCQKVEVRQIKELRFKESGWDLENA